MNWLVDLIPTWGWLTISYIAFFVTILISAHNYIKKKLNNAHNIIEDLEKELEDEKKRNEDNPSIRATNKSGVVSADTLSNSPVHIGDTYVGAHSQLNDDLRIRIKIYSNGKSALNGRFLRLTMYNDSQSNIDDCEVILVNARNNDNPNWNLNSWDGRTKRFIWSDQGQINIDRRTVKAGGNAEVLMVQTYPKSPEKSILFQVIPTRLGSPQGVMGQYRIDIKICGIHVKTAL